MKTSYDRTTDSLYIELRPLRGDAHRRGGGGCRCSTWARMASPSATTSSTRPGSAS